MKPISECPYIDVKDIIISKDRVRKDFSCVMDMVKSLSKHGQLQPIVLTRKDDGKLHLVIGETRSRACLFVDSMKGKIAYVLKEDLNDLEALEIELEENLVRKGLEGTERLEGLRRLDELKRKIHGDSGRGGNSESDGAWTVKKTAELTGESVQAVSRQLITARKLKARPELFTAIPGLRNLPISAMHKAIENFEEGEKTKRLIASGHVEPRHSLPQRGLPGVAQNPLR